MILYWEASREADGPKSTECGHRHRSKAVAESCAAKRGTGWCAAAVRADGLEGKILQDIIQLDHRIRALQRLPFNDRPEPLDDKQLEHLLAINGRQEKEARRACMPARPNAVSNVGGVRWEPCSFEEVDKQFERDRRLLKRRGTAK